MASQLTRCLVLSPPTSPPSPSVWNSYPPCPLMLLTCVTALTIASITCALCTSACASLRPHRSPGDPECGGYTRLPLMCLPSLGRYAIPPEHGKRLERLAIGRCLHLWAGTWDLCWVIWEGEVGRKLSSLPGLLYVWVSISGSSDVLQNVTVLFSHFLVPS